MKRSLMALVMIVALIGWGAWSWTQARDGKEPDERKEPPVLATKTPYVHTVIFYLRDDAPKDQVENMIADAHRLLGKIPSVKGLWIGRPAEKSTPELAVKDYSVAMLILFEDHAGLKEYLEHKLHLEFREKHAKHAERVPVYDFIDLSK